MSDGLERVRRVWSLRTASEYRSATVGAQFAWWALQLGLPPEVVRQAQRLAADELDHAELCYGLYRAAGGEHAPAPVPELWLHLPQDPEAPLALRALAAAADEYAVAESVALELFRAICQLDLGQAAAPVIQRLVLDEARHAAFGWSALDALLACTGDEGRAFLQPRLDGYAERVRREYRARSRPTTPVEAAWGLLTPSRYREIVDATLAGPVTHNLAKRGLTLSAPVDPSRA